LIAANTCGYNIGTFLLNNLRLHPKLIVGCAGSFALIGIFCSSYTTTLAPYLALYTGMNGLGCGTCYMVPLVCGWEYFPEKKGMVTGVVIGAYGFGSFFFSLLSTHLVNPTGANPTIADGKNVFYEPEIANNVPYMIRTLVYIWIGLVLAATLLISRRPKSRVDIALKIMQQKQQE
jgi:MFS transporter, OFA family, oxalate/formate antiporter